MRSLAAVALVSLSCALRADVAERISIYVDGPAKGWHSAAWSMHCEERRGPEQTGRFLWVNGDCKAQPWAGVRVSADADAPGIEVTDEWLATGFVSFEMTAGYDRYGNPGSVAVQLRPEAKGLRYQFLRSAQIARGRGLDEDPESWQEALVPLSYWTELKAGNVIRGLSLQNRAQANRPIGYRRIEFVRFREVPEWLRRQGEQEVAQPNVAWPAHDELPARLRGGTGGLHVRDGAFVDADGRRAFVVAPYCREDRRLDLWGTTDAQRGAGLPAHGLFDSGRHGWIYQDLFTRESIRRLGFNAYSATMPPQPFWEAVGFPPGRAESDPALLADSHRRMGVPFFVDTVCWPWTLGAPGNNRDKSPLPPTVLTEGRNHWVPYRIVGEGREMWLRMWRIYAERYRDAGVPVVGFELLNEPAYLGRAAEDMAGFATWLQNRYASLAELNRTWETTFASWQAAADVREDERIRQVVGRFFDYDDYLSERFCELVRAGVEEVRRALPGVPTGVQTMGGYAVSPREAVFLHRFVRHETLVITPTGGGRWTAGGSAAAAPASRLLSPIAPAPLENDLLLALADGKMVFDNETYLAGQDRREIRNRLWKHVLCGLDGLTVFSWSKRGWAWWKDRQQVQTEADKYPYSNLNPLARRTDALRGILDFTGEVSAVAGDILPKGWGPRPVVGLLYSWPQARRCVLDANTPDKTAAYYAALKHDHANLRLLPSDRAMEPGGLDGLAVVVLGGVRHLEPELVPVLVSFVENGGTLVYGEAVPQWDIYGHGLPALPAVGVLGEADAALSQCEGIELRCGVRTVADVPDGQVLLRDAAARPVLLRRRAGKGAVYVQLADVVGYSLAELLDRIFADLSPAPDWFRVANVHEDGVGRAANVLVSRRSYPDRHVLLLQNLDGYTKRLRVRLPDVGADWQVRDALAESPLQPGADGALPLELGPGDPAVLVWRRR